MICSFPNCLLDCSNCSEYKGDNTVKDELLDYIESNEADSYLCSMEAHEEKYLDQSLPY